VKSHRPERRKGITLKRPLLITSEPRFAEALCRVAAEVFGVRLEALRCEQPRVRPYGDVWFGGPGGHVAAASELRRRWEAGEISHAVVGPLGQLPGGPRLFAAFLWGFHRCPVPVVGMETRVPEESPPEAGAAYKAAPGLSVVLMAEALAVQPPAVSLEVGEADASFVRERLRRVIAHDLGKMQYKARRASAPRAEWRDAGARELLGLYSALRPTVSFFAHAPELSHLLPENALPGLVAECEAVVASGSPLDGTWAPRLQQYIGECVVAVEGWR
jgi:hypothetical protein